MLYISIPNQCKFFIELTNKTTAYNRKEEARQCFLNSIYSFLLDIWTECYVVKQFKSPWSSHFGSVVVVTMVVLGFIHIFWMQVSISSGVWAESLHALQNAPPIRGGMLNDLSDGRIKKKTLFKDKIRLIHGVSKRIRIYMYSNCICVFIMLNISWIQHPYIWLQTSNHVYMAFFHLRTIFF